MDKTQATIAATLTVAAGGEDQAPAGALITADGRRWPFCGWIELASAIEDWRNSTQTTDSDPRTTGGR